MSSQDQNEPWKSIAARKQKERTSKIPKEYFVPDDQLPRDPPTFQDGPQRVLTLPRKFLSRSEVRITEFYTVPSLLSALSSRRITASEVAAAFVHRAAIAQQLTNCLTEILFDSAFKRAAELDSYLRANGAPVGPLHGLPVTIKDTFDVAGVDSSMGLASLCFRPAKANAPLVDLLLSLGCVIIAKTNIPQTLASLDSINNVFGRTLNPLNRLLTAGGSSGGEGVIVAMKGCMIGFGTDIGGSIRVPAMCNGVYGFKPSTGRLPYGGQVGTDVDGISRVGVQAVAGPIARSVEDIAVVMREVVPRSKMFGEDCFASQWDTIAAAAASAALSMSMTKDMLKGCGPQGEFVIGVLRSDGNCNLLPPIRNIIDEVASSLRHTRGIKVVDIPTPKAWTRAQSVMNKLMSTGGSVYMTELIEATNEPVVPWMSTRFKRHAKARSLEEVAQFQSQRKTLEREMLDQVWTTTTVTSINQNDKTSKTRGNQGDTTIVKKARKIDALICAVAPHPVPEIDHYNSVGYTSSWVLFDNPAGTIPVRSINERDLEISSSSSSSHKSTIATTTTPKVEPISSWDEKCRELWYDDNPNKRKVYLGSMLSVQVVVPKAEDEGLVRAMGVIDSVVKRDNPDTSEGGIGGGGSGARL